MLKSVTFWSHKRVQSAVTIWAVKIKAVHHILCSCRKFAYESLPHTAHIHSVYTYMEYY